MTQAAVPEMVPGPDDRVGAVADELAIRNVIARIAHYSDAGELDDYGALFAEDARWEMPGVPVKRSRDEIVAAGAERRAAGTTGPGSATRHLVGTTAVTVRGDTAVADSYFQFYGDTGGTPVLQQMGAYRDCFRRTPDGWQLTERLITPG
ncbi:nuclear transport factor 2 family protein [Streptomyces sp. NPDC002577]